MATARWVRTTPGSWVCQLIPHSDMAEDMACVRPLHQPAQQRGAGVRHQILPVGGHPHRLGGATTFTFKEPFFSLVGLLP